jgi:arsenate reductase-like glutaredoxin family protein
VLDRKKISVKEERHSKKSPMSAAEAKRLLASVSEVVLARGKSSRRIPAKTAKPDDLRGPSGGFRAPMVKRGKTLLVGFNADELEKLIADG